MELCAIFSSFLSPHSFPLRSHYQPCEKKTAHSPTRCDTQHDSAACKHDDPASHVTAFYPPFPIAAPSPPHTHLTRMHAQLSPSSLPLSLLPMNACANPRATSQHPYTNLHSSNRTPYFHTQTCAVMHVQTFESFDTIID